MVTKAHATIKKKNTTMKLRASTLISLFCLALISGVLQAQTVDKILKKHLKESGSKKYKKVETVKMMGNLPTPQGDFPLTTYSKKPNKMKVELDIMGTFIIPSAYDGKTAWMINPMTGDSSPQKFPEEGALLIADQAQLEPLYINYADKGYNISLDGTEDVNGRNCYKLKIEKSLTDNADNNTQYHYFDTETYMVVKVNVMGADGNRVDTFFSDFKKTDSGITFPFTMEIDSAMGLQKISFTEIIINDPIDDEVFVFPG